MTFGKAVAPQHFDSEARPLNASESDAQDATQECIRILTQHAECLSAGGDR